MLPAELTPFLGRRKEAPEVRRLLESSRLLTLTGPGGIGKTRLALHTARKRHRAFPGGVWYVDLSTLTDPSLLPQTVSAAMGLPDMSTTSRTETPIDYLAGRQGLLVLDNCEHLVDGCAHLARTLLRASEGLRILATSRQPLGLEGEQIFQVPPLTVPLEPSAGEPAEVLARYESVSLFVSRAQAVFPEFHLDADKCPSVARLCRDLEGIPLAIELAAVRMRSLSVEQIVARLDDRFKLLTIGHRGHDTRQTSLTAMVEWSYDLLDPLDRTLWARLTVFAGSFDLAAAEAVCCDDDLPAEELLDRLHSLVEKSIVIRDDDSTGVRYCMLDTLRQFGRGRLGESGELETVRARHRDWCGALASQATTGWAESEQRHWSRRLKSERHNIRAAIEYCLTTPNEAISGLHLAADLWPFWLVHAVSEGRCQVERLLAALPGGAEADAARVRGLWLAGWLAFYQGDLEATRLHGQESRALAERLGDDRSRAYATYVLGLSAVCDHDYPRARSLLSTARDHHEVTGDLPGRWLATADLAGVLGALGEIDAGVELCDSVIEQCARRGARWNQSYLLWILADLRRLQGDLDEATRLLKEILDINRDFEDPTVIGACLESLSWLATRRKDAGSVAWLLGAAHATWGKAGISLLGYATWGAEHDNACDYARESLGETAFEEAYQRGARMTPTATIDRILAKPTKALPREPRVRANTEELTPRELEIAELITEGLTNKKIAQRLIIAQRTAEGHVERILRKLGCTSRAQVAAWWTSRTAS
ncbi:ATP-binding protein [Nonomuraea jiangxiensis]|uniref:Non-specific serine/threonine protein kinase n=1 Tax=Nonomuraea jiangxiensis TaxID=633440 RepID=A0A1G8FI48_9ACTN|nr:LuxR C-terminal-related transcriptional regulator [Nonomuraea jiangxiensis]SDH81746.1 non-specific serine/threonine protein kinase [Nonomuraea jiangxiensis]